MLNKFSKLALEIALLSASTLSFANSDIEISQININVNGNIQNDTYIQNIIQSKYQGSTINAITLQDILNEITAYYRDNGYPSSKAFLPEQDISSAGILEVDVIYSKINNVELQIEKDSLNNFAKTNIDNFLENLENKQINDKDVYGHLLTLADLNQFDISASLNEVDNIETNSASLLVNMQGKNKYTAGILFNNHGIESTGIYRAEAFFNINNLTKSLDDLTLGISTTNEHNNNFNINYEIPLNSYLTKSITSLCLSDYELAKEFKELGANGNALTFDTSLSHPIYRDLDSKVYVNGGFRYRKLKDSFDTFSIDLKKHSLSLYAGLNTTFNLNDKTTLNTQSSITASKLKSDDDYDLIENENFLILKNYADINYIFNNKLSTTFSFDSQFANKSIDGSEYFSLGGADAMAAYKSNAFNGDDGFILSAKLNVKPFEDINLYLSPNMQFGYINLKDFANENASSLGFDITFNQSYFYTKAQNNFALKKFEDTDSYSFLISFGFIYS